MTTVDRRLLALSVLILTTTGCFVHRTRLASTSPTAVSDEAERDHRLEAAHAATVAVTDRASAERAAAAWEDVLAVAPGHPEALSERAWSALLLGAAYSRSCREQEAFYRETLHWSEEAMATVPEFRRRLEVGESPWEAVEALGADQMDAMNLWFTALFYQYRDCLSPLGKVTNLRWIRRAERVMRRMTEIDPDWRSGALHFAWGIYHLALPESAGGDRDQAAVDLARAVELGPDWLLYRWGRGRYFHLETGNRAAFREDLEWVVSQDLATAGGRPEWNVYFQREARELLERIDELFPEA